MRIKGSVSVALAMAISLLLIPGIAIATGFRAKHLTQSRLTINSSGRPLVVQPHFVEVDRLAPEVKKGSEPAVRSMTSELSKEIGIPSEVATAYGFNERIVQSELSYRRGGQQGAREDDVVKAVNNLVASVGAPAWAFTNVHEVKRLRMLLVIRYPHLIASEAPPDEKGHYKALDDTMSPLEATYVGGVMIQQKLLNPDFQFSDQEKNLPGYADKNQRAASSASRGASLRKIVTGQSSWNSVRDLLNASDNFLTDLHVAQSTTGGSR